MITHVIFDFDGTLSWLRHGWPELMVEILKEHIRPRDGETEESLHELLLDDVLSLNGKPSIYQMMRAAERAVERGQPRPEPEVMLAEYQSRLEVLIQDRTSQIESGKAKRDDFVVFGARELLEKLRNRGLTLIVLSGTREPRVKAEAALLDLARSFGSQVYGSGESALQFSKRDVMERLLKSERIEGKALLSFGDGPVEIRVTKELGGLAVGVASDEEVNGSGRMHPQKVKHLQAAGADIVIPDYREPEALIERVLGA